MIKLIAIFLVLMPWLSMAADKAGPSAIDKKAAELEAQLNKSLDTSPEGAKVMIELVDLYYNEGRVFGLVRRTSSGDVKTPRWVGGHGTS